MAQRPKYRHSKQPNWWVTQINLQPIENLRKSNYGQSAIWMSAMQEENQSDRGQDNRFTARRCGNNPMHSVQLHDGCTDRGFKCQSMSLNAQCAKSVLKWISQSMTKTNQSAAGQTWVAGTQVLAFHSRVKAGVINE
jgi:hypothetical protein